MTLLELLEQVIAEETSTVLASSDQLDLAGAIQQRIFDNFNELDFN